MKVQNDDLDFKELLEDFYRKYNQSKLSSIHEILESFKHSKKELLLSLKLKYKLSKYDPFDKFLESTIIPANQQVTCNFILSFIKV